MVAHYALHKFHWRPSEILELSREELAFVFASIEIKSNNEKEEQKKLESKAKKGTRKR